MYAAMVKVNILLLDLAKIAIRCHLWACKNEGAMPPDPLAAVCFTHYLMSYTQVLEPDHSNFASSGSDQCPYTVMKC